MALDVAGSNWRGRSSVNVPVASSACRSRSVPPTRADVRPGADPVGTALLGATLLCLLVPLSEGAALGWPAWSWALLGMTPLCAAAFACCGTPLRAGREDSARPDRGRQPADHEVQPGPGAAFLRCLQRVHVRLCPRHSKRAGPGADERYAGLAIVPMAAAFGAASLAAPRLLGDGPKGRAGGDG